MRLHQYIVIIMGICLSVTCFSGESAKLGNTTVAYQLQGHGDKTLLFVHALPLEGSSWQCQVERFKKDYQVLTIDLPGYGHSSKLGSYDMEHLSFFYARIIKKLLTHLKINQVTYIGAATGGHVGMAFAAEYPELVDKLVLVSTSPQFASTKDWPYGFSANQIEVIQHLIDDQPLGKIGKVLAIPAFQEACPKQLQPLIQEFIRLTRVAGRDTLKSFFRNIVYEDLRQLLPKIKAPTLIIQPTLNQEVIPNVGLYMRQHIANAQLVEVNGADHFIYLTTTRLFNDIIANFLQHQCDTCLFEAQ